MAFSHQPMLLYHNPKKRMGLMFILTNSLEECVQAWKGDAVNQPLPALFRHRIVQRSRFHK